MKLAKVTRRPLFFTLALAVSLFSIGCGDSAPAFETAEATALIKAEFPEAELEVRTTRVDEEGKGVAFARFNDEVVSFIFQPTEDGWVLDAVDFDGSLYYIRDLAQTSATMQVMADLASSLERFKIANGGYPQGETAAVLQEMVPDFVVAETEFNDAWERPFRYDSDGRDYTLISLGADGTSGSRDDIVLHSGEFIGAPGRGGQGQS